ncbi:hypothetical protein LMG1861_02633 [Achromobacter piechaudii]|uniref:Xanthine dehydrogenase n=2 Tax=Achromobacter piechaudii TaxID=72556 RepID=A0A6S7CZ36_9BURK|nr:hypothetical protein LMG1861_02633 [Achromobacter piechaudii]
MVLAEHGEVIGSVSGGCIEDDLIRSVRAHGVKALVTSPSVLRYGVSAEEAHRFGLPCGGTVELVMERVGENSRLAELIQRCAERRCTERSLDLRSGIVSLREGAVDGLPSLTDSHLVTQLGPQARLIVIGATDLTLYLCAIARSLNFDITVCDPREEFYRPWKMDGIRLTREMPDDLVLRLDPDARTAVIALTHDPKLDDLALIEALQSRAFYVGAIGSRGNNARRRERLKEHFGLPDSLLERLRGPAGLYIGSKTPAEIALSIMAEVVATKNGVERCGTEGVAAGKHRQQSGGNDAAGQSICGAL